MRDEERRLWSWAFWRGAATRAVKTSAQALAAILTASGAGLLDTDWVGALSAAGMAGLLALLVNIGGEA